MRRRTDSRGDERGTRRSPVSTDESEGTMNRYSRRSYRTGRFTKVRLARVSVIAAAAALILAACGGGSGDGASEGGLPSVIKIGQVDSFSGPYGSCAAAADGAQIAIDHSNEAEMFGPGVKVELVRVDEKGTSEGAVTGYRNLLRQKVVGILGPCTTATASSIVAQADANKVPLLLAAPGEPSLVEHDYVFRGGPPQAKFAAETIAALAATGAKRVSVVYTNDFPDTAAVWKEAWEPELKKQGITLAGLYPVPTGVPNISSVLERIRQDDPDAIGLDTFGSPTLTYAKQLRNAGLEQPLFGQIVMAYGFYNTSDAAAAGGGSYYATSFLPTLETDVVSKFVKDYKKVQDNAEPDPAAAQVYDATLRLLEAIKSAGSVDGPKVQKALSAQTRLDGAEGPIDYIDGGHEATSDGFVMHVDSSGTRRVAIKKE